MEGGDEEIRKRNGAAKAYRLRCKKRREDLEQSYVVLRDAASSVRPGCTVLTWEDVVNFVKPRPHQSEEEPSAQPSLQSIQALDHEELKRQKQSLYRIKIRVEGLFYCHQITLFRKALLAAGVPVFHIQFPIAQCRELRYMELEDEKVAEERFLEGLRKLQLQWAALPTTHRLKKANTVEPIATEAMEAVTEEAFPSRGDARVAGAGERKGKMAETLQVEFDLEQFFVSFFAPAEAEEGLPISGNSAFLEVWETEFTHTDPRPFPSSRPTESCTLRAIQSHRHTLPQSEDLER